MNFRSFWPPKIQVLSHFFRCFLLTVVYPQLSWLSFTVKQKTNRHQFLSLCPTLDDRFCYNIVKVVCRFTWLHVCTLYPQLLWQSYDKIYYENLNRCIQNWCQFVKSTVSCKNKLSINHDLSLTQGLQAKWDSPVMTYNHSEDSRLNITENRVV